MISLDAHQHYLRNALALAHAAHAAYDDKPAEHKQFAKLSWDKVKFIHVKRTDTQAFVASNADNLVVAFRGTEPKRVRDITTDVRLFYYEKRVYSGRVHDGFWRSWLSIRDRVIDQMKSVRTKGQTIWFAGHSLGAALATLAARDMSISLRPEQVFTFGSPRCGNPQFAAAYKVPLKRFVNENDIITHVPLQGLFTNLKYCHVGHRQLIMPNGQITSSEAVWTRQLREVAKIAVLGVGAVGADALRSHSMTKYVAKLANHGVNKHRSSAA